MGPRDLPVSQRWLGLERKSGTVSLVCPGVWFLSQRGLTSLSGFLLAPFSTPVPVSTSLSVPLLPCSPIVSFVLGTLAVQNLDGLSLPHNLRVWDTRPHSH